MSRQPHVLMKLQLIVSVDHLIKEPKPQLRNTFCTRRRNKANNQRSIINSNVYFLLLISFMYLYKKHGKRQVNRQNYEVPVSIRGSLTHYETLMQVLPSAQKKNAQNIPLMNKTLNQCIKENNKAIIITYQEAYIQESIRNIKNSQNIILIERSKIPVIPLRIQGKSLNKQQKKICQILNNNHIQITSNQYVLVVKRGLFDQIIVLNFYDLFDPNLFEKVLKSVDDRESFQSEVRSIANSEYKMQESNQPFADKYTASTRSEALSSV